MKYKEQLDMIGADMIKKHHTIAVAESVTSGRLQKILSNIKDASSFYRSFTCHKLQLCFRKSG